jgi:2',3'-cyclic-nucleotide 2'-phosphodiesterase (5'-nucleotidase family)
VPGIDVMFYGHTHEEIPKVIVNGVLMVQAKNWGGSLARAEVTMERNTSGKWTVASKTSTTIHPTAETPQDPEIVKLLEPYEEKVEAYLNTSIATTSEALDGALARYADEPLVDAIQRAQMQYGHADVSMATMFIPSTHVAAGTVTIRDAFGIYPYENALYSLEMTGAQLKDALEHAASSYPAWARAGGKADAFAPVRRGFGGRRAVRNGFVENGRRENRGSRISRQAAFADAEAACGDQQLSRHGRRRIFRLQEFAGGLPPDEGGA